MSFSPTVRANLSRSASVGYPSRYAVACVNATTTNNRASEIVRTRESARARRAIALVPDTSVRVLVVVQEDLLERGRPAL